KNTIIEPFVHIGADVVIGENCWIGAHVSIMDGSRIGDNCHIFPGAVIGAIPQDLKFGGEKSVVVIGNNVTIREYCTVNRGTKDLMRTEIKDNCLLMAYVHVAHDCIIHANCILANNVTLAGHIEIGEYAILGGLSAVHQFVKIGEHAMIGGTSKVRKDVPPFVKAARDPLAYVGVNSIGLNRRGFTSDQITAIQDVYRLLYVKETNVHKGLDLVKSKLDDSPEKARIIEFVESSKRGLMKGFRYN
ncbi:MAG TPA: acyl-ACP--UDP-N-acetylglucosamine O-acyltransferase, partial [Saprospiraceae bacterium]|nr:acyl-ACP--UDP-N-acetylglucosamine O-acyltransferase [Saprospiraceae bacterium]